MFFPQLNLDLFIYIFFSTEGSLTRPTFPKTLMTGINALNI